MERTVPSTESEEVDLYQRTYYSLLRSTAEVKIRTLEEVHAGMNSLLHPGARESASDMAAFIYSILRLPACIVKTRLVVLGQNAEVFERFGFEDLRSWQEVFATARRRRSFYNGKDVLAFFIASRSDIDDIIPLLTAYQIEWNKLHQRLKYLRSTVPLHQLNSSIAGYSRLAEMLEIPEEDFDRLFAIWDEDFAANLERIAEAPCDLRVHLLSGSLNEYRRARNHWWENIENNVTRIRERPVYFISSNTHCIVNILSGFALQCQERLVRFLEQPGNSGLLNEWKDIQAGRVPSSRENFLYYVLKKAQQSDEGGSLEQEQKSYEKALGIERIPSRRSFDVEAQVIDLAGLKLEFLDRRLRIEERGRDLAHSDALILNIDYPLGLAAYDILSEVSSYAGSIQGVYVMGKAATLNAVIGDVMISNVVHDEHSQNTYLFPNCFTADDVAPDLVYGTVLDNQKSVTVQGTFLQNTRYMDVFYREGYTVIEMEAGPYLSAVFEMYRPQRHPVNEIVNLYGLPFDLGMIHYASDTPLGKGKNLGAGSLSYFGMDATYGAALATLRRIFDQELLRLQTQRKPRG
jgi:Family of unknown function (DUF6909)